MNIAIISGSPRQERQSHQVALYLQQQLNTLNIPNWIFDIRETALPFLDYTFSTHPGPGAALKSLQAKLDETDGFIIVSPEHNASYPGALKNAMDYFFAEYKNKPFGIVSVSSGILGGINAVKSLQLYVIKLNGILLPEFLLTPQVQHLFEGQKLQDESYGKRVDQFLLSFFNFHQLVSR